eukprot:1306274-Rhodomonas_salina.7
MHRGELQSQRSRVDIADGGPSGCACAARCPVPTQRLATDATSALRRTMETYTKITRFCIICNYVSR